MLAEGESFDVEAVVETFRTREVVAGEPKEVRGRRGESVEFDLVEADDDAFSAEAGVAAADALDLGALPGPAEELASAVFVSDTIALTP